MIRAPVRSGGIRGGLAGGEDGGFLGLLSVGVLGQHLAFARAQAAGALATADVDIARTLLQPGSVLAPLTLARAQAGGALSTGDL